MNLDEIINYDTAISTLSRVGDTVRPFKISDKGEIYYRLQEVQLEIYLSQPNEDEINQFLNKFKLQDDCYTIYDKPTLLKILLRLHHFELLTKIPHSGTKQSFRIITDFINWFRIIFNSDLETFFGNYMMFSLYLSFDNPKLNATTNTRSVTKSNAKSNAAKEIRHHTLKNRIGLLYPSSSLQKFEVKNIELPRYQFQNMSALGFSNYTFDLKSRIEKDIETIVQKNLLEIPVDTCESLGIRDFTLEGGKGLSKQINGKNFTVEPDLEIVTPSTRMPVEIKIRNLKKYIDNFYSSKLTAIESVPFLEIISQVYREMIATSSTYALLSDYVSTFIIQLNDTNVGDFEGVNFCRLLRSVDCSIYELDLDSEYSVSTQIFNFLVESQKEYDQMKPFITEFQNNCWLPKSIRDSLTKMFHLRIHKWHEQLLEQFVPPPTMASDEEVNYPTINTIASSSFSAYEESTDNINFNEQLILSTNRMQENEKFCYYSMEDIMNSYDFIKILTGDEINTRMSTTIVIVDKKDNSKSLLKIYDPLFSSIYVSKEAVIEGSYKRTFKVFEREVNCLEIVQPEKISPSIKQFGFLRNEGIEKYTEKLDISKGIPLAGFFITMSLIGKSLEELINELSDDQLKTLYGKAQVKLTTLHRCGLVHNDIHAGNILITPEMDVFFIDYAISDLNDFRWPANNESDRTKRDEGDLKKSFSRNTDYTKQNQKKSPLKGMDYT
ncbi:uncharacterized protein RJT21DRAFT_115340 [Scheffersomyces amazonensis]|uniref:uncharacterized protein n=1 Tax=Scheffersomyces amazonensis TaxID=1078765 RepID=UPI00315CFABF